MRRNEQGSPYLSPYSPIFVPYGGGVLPYTPMVIPGHQVTPNGAVQQVPLLPIFVPHIPQSTPHEHPRTRQKPKRTLEDLIKKNNADISSLILSWKMLPIEANNIYKIQHNNDIYIVTTRISSKGNTYVQLKNEKTNQLVRVVFGRNDKNGRIIPVTLLDVTEQGKPHYKHLDANDQLDLILLLSQLEQVKQAHVLTVVPPLDINFIQVLVEHRLKALSPEVRTDYRP